MLSKRCGIHSFLGYFFRDLALRFASHSKDMLSKLKARWGVNGIGLVLILCTFAVGGSLSGFLAKEVMTLMHIDGGWLYLPLYILVVTLLWPISVISVSVLFGQFGFFSRYLRKMGMRMGFIKTQEEQRSIH